DPQKVKDKKSAMESAKSRIERALRRHPLPAALDLTGFDPPKRVIDNADFVSVRDTVIQPQIDSLTTEISKLDENQTKCLRMLDTPENNPEREKVGKALDALKKLDDEIGKKDLTQDQATKKMALLYDLQKEIFAWNDRRTQENLPPARDALV